MTTSDAADVPAPDQPPRIVLVTREGLPSNPAVNAAAVLGATIGAKLGVASADATMSVACLTEVARQARTYESYLSDLAATEAADADVVATVVAGPRSRVTRLTKRFTLLAGPDEG